MGHAKCTGVAVMGCPDFPWAGLIFGFGVQFLVYRGVEVGSEEKMLNLKQDPGGLQFFVEISDFHN